MFDEKLSKWVNAILHNDEVASDEELFEHFINNGLTKQQAQKLIAQREKCLNDRPAGG